MPRFLSKFRLEKLKETKIGGYGLYAFGEIFLVMIGILLALKVNNWNNERLQRRDEIQYLKELKNDSEENLEEAQRDLAAHKLALMNSLTFKDYLMSDDPFNDSLTQIFFRSTRDYNFWEKTGAFENLRVRGFDLISNDTLRKNITDHFQLQLKRLEGIGAMQKNRWSISLDVDLYAAKYFIVDKSSFTKVAIPEMGVSKDTIAYYNYLPNNTTIFKDDQEFLMQYDEMIRVRIAKIGRHQWVIREIENMILQLRNEIERLSN